MCGQLWKSLAAGLTYGVLAAGLTPEVLPARHTTLTRQLFFYLKRPLVLGAELCAVGERSSEGFVGAGAGGKAGQSVWRF